MASMSVAAQDLAQLIELAEKGEATAQDKLGTMYASGDSVPKNFKRAAELFKKSADQGLASAQFHLGLAYRKGQGVQQSNEVAVSWFRKAAEAGYAKAQYSLGYMYANGVGVQKDLNEAVLWISKAADQGLPTAQSAIARLNAITEDVRQREIETISAESLATIVRKDSDADRNKAPASGQVSDDLSEEERLKASTLERIRQRRAAENKSQADDNIDSHKTGTAVGMATALTRSDTDQTGQSFLKDRRVWVVFSGLLIVLGILWLFRVNKQTGLTK